jgi:hypothetical protein
MERFRLVVLAACLLVIPAGIGAFTFVRAAGLSYLSTDPRACVNCHVKKGRGGSDRREKWCKRTIVAQ